MSENRMPPGYIPLTIHEVCPSHLRQSGKPRGEKHGSDGSNGGSQGHDSRGKGGKARANGRKGRNGDPRNGGDGRHSNGQRADTRDRDRDHNGPGRGRRRGRPERHEGVLEGSDSQPDGSGGEE